MAVNTFFYKLFLTSSDSALRDNVFDSGIFYTWKFLINANLRAKNPVTEHMAYKDMQKSK